jgi:hypothetical protein
VLFSALILNAFYMIYRLQVDVRKSVSDNKESFLIYAFSLKVALIIYLTAGFFITAVYVEDLYWLLMAPLFLKRAWQNEQMYAPYLEDSAEDEEDDYYVDSAYEGKEKLV